jgi:RNA polymerase sigma-54 factor
MKLDLHLRLQQRLAPQLIQSLKMLQMPVLRLEQTIRQELVANPLLEEIEVTEPEVEQSDEQTSDFDSTTQQTKSTDEDTPSQWDEFANNTEDEGYKVREYREEKEDRLDNTPAQSKTLSDHLLEQLHMLKLSEEEHMIGEYIIGNIAPDGYLAFSVPEMASELSIDTFSIDKVLQMIQRFDPCGVGARDLRESLLIQLREKGQEGTLAWQVVDEHINDLERKSILQISKTIGVPVERIQQAMAIIKGLSPTPSHGRFDAGAAPVIPDLVVERFGDEFTVQHNDSYVPRLRINSTYRDMVRRGSTTAKDAKDWMRSKLDQAKWLLNAIQQRRSTMIRVMEAIVERQQEFFEKGPAFLKPLIMEEIAQKVEMNVATISRVSNGKYVQTPFGVFEIKHFFNAGIASTVDGAEDLSKQSVKQRIEEIIKAEPADSPLSDQEIFQRLKLEGIQLARRTVTKYREEMKIQPARMRKRIA